MAFPNSSAGVYDNERDLSIRAGSVTSSYGAIIFESGRGEVGVPTLIGDKQDLLDMFGKKDVTKYGFGMYCAEHFLQHSNRLYGIRLADSATALTAGAYLSVDDINASNPVLKLVNWDDGTNNPKGKPGKPLETVGFPVGAAGSGSVPFYVCAISPGEWSKEITVQVRPSAQEGTVPGQFSDVYQFYVDVFLNYSNTQNAPVESFLCSRKVELDGEQQQMFLEDRINNNSKYIRVKNNPNCGPVRVVHAVMEMLDGGADGNRVSNNDIANAWDLVADTEEFDIQILINAGYTNPQVQRKMVSVARTRGDAMAILDLPREHKEGARAVNYRRNILNVNDSYGAMYTPFAKIKDDVSNKDIWVPPSGLVAAQYAYTDRVKSYYWAPAGLTRGQVRVLDIEMKYNKGNQNALDQAQINVIRKIPGRGFVIMGAETLQTFKSGFSNVNVRRLVNGVKSVIRKAVLPSNFNPNDDYERLRLKNIVDGVIRPVRADRGVREWETVCDSRNNTAAVIANNDLVLDLILDPSIPAKRIHLGADIRNFGDSINFSEG